MNTGKLFLIPNIIAEQTQDKTVPLHVKLALENIQHFLAEDIRTARRYLSSLKVYSSIEPLQFHILDKKTKREELKALCMPLFDGHHLGVISESGCPGIADPGAMAVLYAHENNIEVVPLVGPSSLLLALMASGLNGQRFAFQGYLPIESKEAAKAVKEFERESRQKNQTQIFIETPYRNNSIMKVLLKELSESTLLSVSIDLTGENQQVKTMPVKGWRKLQIDYPKNPAVFSFLAV